MLGMHGTMDAAGLAAGEAWRAEPGPLWGGDLWGRGGICVGGGGFILWCCPRAPLRPFAQCCNLSVVTVNRCGPVQGCRASSASAFLSRVWGLGTPWPQTVPPSTHG